MKSIERLTGSQSACGGLKQGALSLLCAVASAASSGCGASLPEGRQPGEPIPTTDAPRRSFTHVGVIDAPAERVFPQLCPVLEYDWLDGWEADLVYTESGFAEEGAIFNTHVRNGETWVVGRYEPPSAVTYVVFAGVAVMVLDVSLDDRGDGTTEVSWTRTYTALTAIGRAAARRLDEGEIRLEMAAAHAALAHYLRTGERLSSDQAQRLARAGR